MVRPPRIAVLLLATVTVALAAETDADLVALDPFAVTAQMRRQSPLEVPISDTAWTGEFLETHGIARYEDLAPFVPGFFAAVQSPGFPTLNLRGLSLDLDDPRAPARVSVFQDGVSLSRVSGSDVALFDLARVEVLKGPQTTLFGASAEAGALSLVSHAPDPGASGRLTAGVGSFDGRSASGYLNQPLGAGWLSRVAFTAVHRDGTIDNLADGSTLNGRATVAVRPSLRWVAADGATTFDLVLNWQRDTPPGADFKSGIVPTSHGDTDPFTAAELNRGAALGLDRTVRGATATFTRSLSPAWSLHAITGWRSFDSDEESDADGSRLFLFETGDRSSGRTLSQELRVNYDGPGRLTAFGGVSYARERAEQTTTVRTDERLAWPFLSAGWRSGLIAAGVPAALANVAVPAMDPFTPQATLPAGFAAFAAVPSLAGLATLAGAPLKAEHADVYHQNSDVDNVDLFADGTWHATDRLEFTAGLRVSFEDLGAGLRVDPSPVPSTLGFLFGAAPNFAAAPTAGLVTDADHTTGWAGRLATRYALNPDLSAYATVTRGRRPEAFNISSHDRFRVGQESIVNTEVGLKGRALQRRLLYSVALFEYHYGHFHTLVQDPDLPTHYLAVDAGRATGRGGELSVQGAVNSATQVFATYGYTEATFDATGDDGQPQRYAGSTLRLTSRHTVALGATFATPAGPRGHFEFTPVWQYRSGLWFDDDNTRFGGSLHQGGYARVNLRFAWLSPSRTWEVAASADNVFDKKFLIDAGNIGADFGLPTFVPGEPRLLNCEVTRRW